MYRIAIKSGTSGYYDEDQCDLILQDIPSNNIPQIGSIIELSGDGVRKKDIAKYLVREVKHSFLIPNKDSNYKFGEWIYVYVIKLN